MDKHCPDCGIRTSEGHKEGCLYYKKQDAETEWLIGELGKPYEKEGKGE